MICRIIIGIVFIFSGFVKAVDPLGSTYKFVDYFNAFELGFLNQLAFPLAIILSVAELLIGISLLLGYRMHLFSWVVLVFMSFFTLLTFILALTNPVTDCGCFGDAIILTNWQTFFKNIVLMGFVLFVFLSRRSYPQVRTANTEWAILGLYFIVGVVFSLYNYRHLPIVDFRPFSIGTNIPSAMEIPEGASPDVYESKLLYRNKGNGEIQEFTIENFPRDTGKWEFVDAESVLVLKGFEPPIHDFLITDPQRNDITSLITNFPGFTMLLISHDLEKADRNALITANNFYQHSLEYADFNFFAITATASEKCAQIEDDLNLKYHFNVADEIMLKTVIRSNPGLVLIYHGTILAKWPYRDFNDPESKGIFPPFSNIKTNEAISSSDLIFMPGILSHYRQLMEKRMIYIFILGFIVSVFVIRTVLVKRR